MNKISKFFTILTLIIMLSGPSFAYHDTVTHDNHFNYTEFLTELFNFVSTSHVDDIDKKKLAEETAKGMLQALDPYSEYYTKEEFKEFQSMANAEYFGIGAQISWEEDLKAIKLDLLFEGSPAKKAGLKNDDLIISVNDEPTSNFTNVLSASKKIKGPEGTIVKLAIKRGDNFQEINVVRGKIVAPLVRVNKFDGYTYIRLTQFAPNAYTDILHELTKDSKGLILDLRSNPGGLLTQATKIVNMFTREGLIVETKHKNPNKDDHVYAESWTMLPMDQPIVVLIDKYSASASEIVSGALQALGRATIIGEKSFGKGSVQSILPLPHGGAIKLTIAKYYTASGEVIHGNGITPDIEASLPEDYEGKFGEMDPVIQTALDFLKNK